MQGGIAERSISIHWEMSNRSKLRLRERRESVVNGESKIPRREGKIERREERKRREEAQARTTSVIHSVTISRKSIIKPPVLDRP